MVEILGYIASAFILISFASNGEKTIRIFNAMSSICYVVYASIIGSIPVLFLNICLLGTQAYVLFDLRNKMKLDERFSTKMSPIMSSGIIISIIIVMLIALAVIFSLPPIELFGLSASGVMLYGFTRKGEKTIRILCLIASIMFVAYGFLINSAPIWGVNTIVSFIHIYKLVRLSKNVPN